MPAELTNGSRRLRTGKPLRVAAVAPGPDGLHEFCLTRQYHHAGLEREKMTASPKTWGLRPHTTLRRAPERSAVGPTLTHQVKPMGMLRVASAGVESVRLQRVMMVTKTAMRQGLIAAKRAIMHAPDCCTEGIKQCGGYWRN